MTSFSLQGRNAVVTGAAHGLGRAIALKLAEAGANVALTYRTREAEAHDVAREIEAKGRLAIALKMDVADRGSIEAAAKEARDALGPLSVLVNNAGMNASAGASDWQAALKGPLACAEVFLPLLAEPGNGAIVHVGCAGVHAGLNALSQAIARSGAKTGVRSNVVLAGLIQLDVTDALSAALPQNGAEKILLKRLGDPDEVADAVVFLSSDASSYITAETLNVNGGLAA